MDDPQTGAKPFLQMGEWTTLKGFAEMMDGFGRIAPLGDDYVHGVTLNIVTKPDPDAVIRFRHWAQKRLGRMGMR